MNNGDLICVIKMFQLQNAELFIYEMSLHEVFRKYKYFSKLICYSESPNAIVFKYYNYGSLFDYIFQPQGKCSVPVKYSLEVAIMLAKQISYAFRLMHEKNFIHNDIKPGNILLDGSEDDALFPVICDFGIVHALNSVKKIRGFKTKEVKAGTLEYCAPEVLNSFKNDKRTSDFKTDVYSLGILF